jgi:2-polyprenyl-3-methyl-5-hydroxy-6-metoxy-1,4-benzoquinol methylase
MIESPGAVAESGFFPDPATEGRLCDQCGGRDFSRLHGWRVGDFWNPTAMPIAIWRCACGCTFLHPVPSSGQLPGEGDWWSGQRKEFRRRRRFKTIWQKVRFAMIGSSKERLLRGIRKVVPAGRFLDAGCGKGEMLLLARPFYDCVGLDPSSNALACVEGKGFNLIQGTLEAADLEESSFDVVLLESVIEHVASPSALLRKAHYVLRHGGIAVVTTPKLNGPSHHLHGRAWNGFRHGYHTFLFTAKTLQQQLQNAGFEVLQHPRRNRILDDILILSGLKR